jgi:hypothetical protein
MNTRRLPVTYQSMIVFTIAVGIVGIVLLLLPDFDLLSMVLSCAALGGLIGGEPGYENQDRRRLAQSYKPAFEWMLLVLLAAFAFKAGSEWSGLGAGAAGFLDAHWPSLMVSAMCILLGGAGLQKQSRGAFA